MITHLPEFEMLVAEIQRNKMMIDLVVFREHPLWTGLIHSYFCLLLMTPHLQGSEVLMTDIQEMLIAEVQEM